MTVTSATQTNYTSASTAKTNVDNSTNSASFEEELTTALETPTTAESTVVKTNEEIIAEYRAKPGGDGYLTADMMGGNFIDNFIAKHEAGFRSEYEFYDKYKDVFIPKYSNYTRAKADSIARELNGQFPDYKAVHFKAYHGGTEEDKEKFEAMLMNYQAFNKYLHEKYDLDQGMGMTFTQEGTRAYNFTVYDQLEKGMSIEEATKYADGVAMTFGGNEASSFQMMGLMGYPDSMEEAMQTPEAEKEINYDRQIDLKDKGINHNFSYTNYDVIFGTDKEGIKKRIAYQLDIFGFLTTHEELVNQKVDELKERSPKWFEFINSDGKYGENLKESFRNSYEVAKLSQDIFEKYGDKIFKKPETSTEELLNSKNELMQRNTSQSKSALEKVLQESA